MRLSVERTWDVSIVRVKETKLTYPVLSSFFAEVRQVVEGGALKLVIDLEAVTCLDSPSIGCLMDVHRLLQERGGVLKVSGLQARVETMLRMSGVYRILDVHDDEAEALAAFGASLARGFLDGGDSSWNESWSGLSIAPHAPPP